MPKKPIRMCDKCANYFKCFNKYDVPFVTTMLPESELGWCPSYEEMNIREIFHVPERVKGSD